MMETIYIIIVTGLIALFFVSLFLYINRSSRNSSVRKNETVNNGEKLNKIIEQNEKIISLLEKNQ
ncbi:hypothetical protein GCM10008983_03720 [Lentibacillus halophilus]|uniref:BhlA holin family protein n=1 Tax=Lentibacillus halophilus TaxID=295065 RepID=A0ABN0Z3A9_9BACI